MKNAKFTEQLNALSAGDQERIEQFEFHELVKEVAAQGFTTSAHISRYIVENQLGFKYENISGVLEMNKSGKSWAFAGGFPTRIYAKLCQELSLGNNETEAKPGRFWSFKELERNQRR